LLEVASPRHSDFYKIDSPEADLKYSIFSIQSSVSLG
jgi:hypothetical protein